MVAPATADLEIARREALTAKAASQGERERALIARLHVGLHPVESQHLEGDAQREPDALGHESLPGGTGEGVVTDECALQRAAHDLVQVDDADDRAVLTPADQEALAARPPRRIHEGAEGPCVPRRAGPPTVQPAAAARQREKLVAVCHRRPAQHHPPADHDGTSPPRPHSSRPRSATSVMAVIVRRGRRSSEAPRSRQESRPFGAERCVDHETAARPCAMGGGPCASPSS